MKGPQTQTGKAALLMVLATVSFSIMTIAVRYASMSMPTFEVAFWRNLAGFAVCVPFVLKKHNGIPRTNQPGKYLLRCSIGIASMYAIFWSISHLPLSQAIAITYSSALFATVAAALFLGEVVRFRRWSAVVAGFVGVLILVRPFSHAFDPGILVAVLAAIFSAAVAVQLKHLTRVDDAYTVVFYTYLFWVFLSFGPALIGWKWPTGNAWWWIVALGLFGTGGQMLWTKAMELGEVSALSPISFVQLPLVTLYGWLWFRENVDMFTIIGAAIILGANFYIAHRETRLAKEKRSSKPTATLPKDA